MQRKRVFIHFLNFQESYIKNKLIQLFTTKNDEAPATFNVPYLNLNALFVWAINEGYMDNGSIRLSGLKKKRNDGEESGM